MVGSGGHGTRQPVARRPLERRRGHGRHRASRGGASRGGGTRATDEGARALKNDTAKRVVVVQALASLPKKDDLVAVLDALKSGKLKSQDAVYVARTAADWADSRAVLVRWLSDNLGAIADKMPSFGVARMVAPVRRVCSKPQRDEAERALTPVVAQIGGSDRRLREALEGSAVCIDLRERQAAAVSAHLQKRRRF